MIAAIKKSIFKSNIYRIVFQYIFPFAINVNFDTCCICAASYSCYLDLWSELALSVFVVAFPKKRRFVWSYSMYLLLLVLPLVGTVLAGFGGRWLGGAGAARITTSGIALTFLLACAVFPEVALAHSPTLLRLTP